MRNTLYILIMILSFFFTSCASQEKKIEQIDFKSHYKFNSEIENGLKNSTDSWKHQASASDYATKGNYRNALIQWDLAVGTKENEFSKTQIDSINQKYSQVKASDYIVEQANKNQVVIINEAHHNSLHRVFTKSLLEKLYNVGYRNLGLEALSYKDDLDSLQRIRKYPIQKTGYYIKDPQFGNLIREAINIGYTIFPYETTNREANGKQREIDQAKKIQEFIETKPNEKFLIHCGFAHVYEGTYKSWEKTMDGRLKEYTGINPLTINQVAYSEKSTSKYNHPLLKALNIKESSVIIDRDNNALKYERGDGCTDIAVSHPNTNYIDSRPNWLFENGNKNVSISLTDIQIEFPVMILAFKKEENINLAVPIDITEVDSKTENCNLGLKKGVYEIVITNGKESFKFEQNVK